MIVATDRRKLGGVIKVLSRPVARPKNADHPNVFVIKRGEVRATFEYRRVTLCCRRFGLFDSEREAERIARRLEGQSPRWTFTVLPWGGEVST